MASRKDYLIWFKSSDGNYLNFLFDNGFGVAVRKEEEAKRFSSRQEAEERIEWLCEFKTEWPIGYQFPSVIELNRLLDYKEVNLSGRVA